MNTGLFVQYVVIGVAVAASFVFTLRKYLPGPWARVQGACGAMLESVALTRALGRRLRTSALVVGAGACGSADGGCSSCGSCATPARAADVIVMAPPVLSSSARRRPGVGS